MFWIVSLERLHVSTALRRAGCCFAKLIAGLLLYSKKLHFSFTLILSLTPVLSDVGHFVVVQSHSTDAPRLSALSISSSSRIAFMSFFCSHCVFVFE